MPVTPFRVSPLVCTKGISHIVKRIGKRTWIGPRIWLSKIETSRKLGDRVARFAAVVFLIHIDSTQRIVVGKQGEIWISECGTQVFPLNTIVHF